MLAHDALRVAAALARHLDEVGRLESGVAPDQLDAVALELVADDLPLGADHVLGHRHEVGDGDLALDPERFAEQAAAGGSGQVQGRLAQGLGGDGAGVDLRPAQDVVAFDDGHPLAELGRLDRRADRGEHPLFRRIGRHSTSWIMLPLWEMWMSRPGV